MAFRLQNELAQDDVEFVLATGDGDLDIFANGVLLGFIDAKTGKLYLAHIDEGDRENLPGLSLSNGRLTVAE